MQVKHRNPALRVRSDGRVTTPNGKTVDHVEVPNFGPAPIGVSETGVLTTRATSAPYAEQSTHYKSAAAESDEWEAGLNQPFSQQRSADDMATRIIDTPSHKTPWLAADGTPTDDPYSEGFYLENEFTGQQIQLSNAEARDWVAKTGQRANRPRQRGRRPSAGRRADAQRRRPASERPTLVWGTPPPPDDNDTLDRWAKEVGR